VGDELLPIDAEHRTPGQLIQSLLEARQWSQRTLSIVLGISETLVSKIIGGSQSLTAEIALGLSEIFNVPAEQFLHLQKQYELAQAKLLARPDPKRANRAVLFGALPVTDMIKRGWLDADDVKNVPAVEAALTKFFGAATPDEIEILPHAAKKTNVSTDITPVQLAWLFRVKQIAADMLVPKYSEAATRAALSKLDALLLSPEEARHVPRILEACGIRFVLVETLPGANIDGVCFWLNGQSPVIGMSTRYDRIDNFWFVLRHEIEHVLRGHGKVSIPLDYELEGEKAGLGSDLSEEERVANEAAAEFCVPQTSLKALIDRKAPFFAERDILGFAKSLGIHPGLVAGQLQRYLKRYDRFKSHLVKIRHIVRPAATVDGWGDVYPLES
jgi:HTH-type transcriptional regulator/antitoxin HigA